MKDNSGERNPQPIDRKDQLDPKKAARIEDEERQRKTVQEREQPTRRSE